MVIKAKCVIGAKSKDGTGPLYAGCMYDVEDSLAKSLIARGVAEFGEILARPARAGQIPRENPSDAASAPEGPKNDENGDIVLDDMTYTELKAYAQDLGIETGKIKSKAGMIEAIRNAALEGALPVITPQEVIDE